MKQNNESKKPYSALKLNLLLLLGFGLALLALFAYYKLSPNYNGAKNAKALYDAGRYEEALEISEKVYAENKYNVMAYSVSEQSKIALRYKRYVDQAIKYEQMINEMTQTEKVDPADIIRIKLMLEAAAFDFVKLGGTGYNTDEKLVKEANEYNAKFTAIYSQLIKSIDR